MDLGEFEDYCNNNIDTRKLEISVLKQILNKNNNTDKENKVLKRLYIVFIYSNWQGFIDEISKKYLEFVNVKCSKGICCLDIKFHTGNLKINVLQSDYFNRLCIDYSGFKNKCYNELRFNKSQLKKINGGKNTELSISENFHDNLCYIINTFLIDKRNNISHGTEIILPSIEELNILSDFVLKILEKYKDYLYENLEKQTYLIKKIDIYSL